MSDLKKTFEQYTALPRAALLKTAGKNANIALTHLKKVKAGSEHELLSAVIATALGADGQLSEGEMDFIGELFSEPKEKLSVLTSRFESEKMRDVIDRMIDGMKTEGKRAICTLCLCILASDHRISPEENAFLLRLMQ